MSRDKKRKQLELSRVKLAREEMELKIEERLEEIERLKNNIQIQINKEKDLEKEIRE